MKWSNLNPVTWVNKGLDAAEIKSEPKKDTTNTSVAPANNSQIVDDVPKDAVPVERGIWIDASMIDESNATRQTEEFRRVVQSFDEDKQSKLAWFVGKFFFVLAYLAPILLGWYAGLALGDALTGRFDPWDAHNAFSHLISMVLELCIPMIGYAVAISFKRASKDRRQVPSSLAISAVFLLLAVGNAISQDVLLYAGFPQHTTAQIVAIWFRSFGPSIVDILATIFISIVGVRSLQKYLADQREKIHATREVSLIHIEMDKTTLQAGIDKQNALQDMKSKAKRAATWNEIESMQAESMIQTARQNMLGNGENGGNYRRGRF